MSYAEVFMALRMNGFWHVACDEQRLVNHLRCEGRITLEEHERLWFALAAVRDSCSRQPHNDAVITRTAERL